MSRSVAELLQGFSPISLDTLKGKAELMERRDNKYVLNSAQIQDFLDYTKQSFNLLEIDGLRQFHYLSKYFDSTELTTHDDHNKGRRRRIKVRQRHYVDSGRHYFEVKLKGFRQLTKKFRIPFDPVKLGKNSLNKELLDFFQKIIVSHNQSSWPHDLLPSISVGYDRITLVSKAGNKRITLDNGIYFIDETFGNSKRLNDDKWVVEVKSATGRTAVDRWLFHNNIRPVSQCSKYGMGINLLKQPEVNNRFSVVLRQNFHYGQR